MRNRAGGGNSNSPAFVLVDKTGKPRCYITPDAGVDLSDMVNQRVGVRGSVRAIDGDPMPLIMARAVRAVGDPAPPATAATAATPSNKPATQTAAAAQPVQQAAHTNRVAQRPSPAAEELPAPQPVADPQFSGNVINDGQSEVFYSEPGEFAGPHESCGCDMCNGDDCGSGHCNACISCCLANDPGRWWVRADYLLWSTKGMYIPPLATTGPSDENPGILGEPGTEILFGDQTINGATRSGGRISFGTWLDPCQTWGLSAEYFGLEDTGENFYAESDANGVPTISRPYFTAFGFNFDGSVKEPGENAELVSLEDVLRGSLRVETNTSLQGAGAFLRYNICCTDRCWDYCGLLDPCSVNPCGGVPGGVRVGVIGGYRYMRLGDGVSITEDLTSLSTVPAEQGSFWINDNFRSTNQFNGAEVGFIVEARRARWTMELTGRLALGNNSQTVQIDGTTIISGTPTDNGIYEGGLLALPTNIGTHKRDQFSAIPQLGINLGYNITPKLRAIVGYTFIYWGNVVRAGEQISLDVNETYIPRAFDEPEGPARPAFAWRETDFWAQGLNVGLDYRW
jgi:hypothetical protein